MSIQSSKKNLKSIVSQSKPFNRLIEFGFEAQDLLKIQEQKDKIKDELDGRLQKIKDRITEIEQNKKSGKYIHSEYSKHMKKAKAELVKIKKRIKIRGYDESDLILKKASNLLNQKVESSISSSGFMNPGFIKSKAKELLPHFKEDTNYPSIINDQEYSKAWEKILKEEAHRFPDELAAHIKILEQKRQAIMDLMSYYQVPDLGKLKRMDSVYQGMLSNIDKDLKECQKRLKDPEYDFSIRLRDASTNDTAKETLFHHREDLKKYREIKKSLKKGEKALNELKVIRELKELNALKINPPNDESRLFTPPVQLRFSPTPGKTQVPSNPLQLTAMTQEEKRDRRKSVHF